MLDKTLVVWAAPANLTQRGGSALTIDDGRDHFDGIVFGELAAAKWMAGSDGYLRTEKDQGSWAAETAAPGTFVQLAITYKDRQVTMYRNGQAYAQYTMATPPQEFAAWSMVNIGKRHRRQSDAAQFAGAIDDARIYAGALTAAQIAALQPNVASELKPWAWWSFDDKEAKDRTGRFVSTELVGGAKVEDGKLVLDGVSGQLLAKTGTEVPIVYEQPAWPAKPPAEWLTYHLAHPGPGNGMPGDPNCAFFWKGRYHLHYIYAHQAGFSFAHVSSADMVHWKWHPTTLTPPKTGHGMFSGTGFFTKDGKPAIIYHGEGSGRNQIAFALDDNLEKWSTPMPIMPKEPSGAPSTVKQWDPDCWLNGNTYYGLSGGGPPYLMKSPDLTNWVNLGELMHERMPTTLGVSRKEDVSCANMFHLGNKWMLLCISHNLGCRYYLSDFVDEKFLPEFHAMMNWRAWEFFAPESLLTPDGRRVMWAWCNLGYPQSGIQSLPRELSLPADGVLRIKPLRELEQLREEAKHEATVSLKSEVAHPLKEIAGDALELKIHFQPGTAKEFGVEVYCDAAGNNGFPIIIEPGGKILRLGDLKVPFELRAGEALDLRVFLDKNVIEVFANERQAAVASHRYAAGNHGIRLVSRGGDAVASDITGWKMKSTYPQPKP